MRQFSARELNDHLQESDHPPQLLDVREEWEFDYCHIEHSVLIPMGEIHTRLDELDPKREVVVICHHGIRSGQVGRFLEYQGFENVINLKGGVEDWATQVDSHMPRY